MSWSGRFSASCRLNAKYEKKVEIKSDRPPIRSLHELIIYSALMPEDHVGWPAGRVNHTRRHNWTLKVCHQVSPVSLKSVSCINTALFRHGYYCQATHLREVWRALLFLLHTALFSLMDQSLWTDAIWFWKANVEKVLCLRGGSATRVFTDYLFAVC